MPRSLLSSRIRVSSDQGAIFDTSVLLYFLLAEQVDLLRELIGRPLAVPVTVYDPSDRDLAPGDVWRPELLSELRQAVRYYAAGTDRKLLERVCRIDYLFDNDLLHVVEMTEDEACFAAHLQSRSDVKKYKLRASLGPGEAACVAVAWERGWTIATDDDAALQVLDNLHGSRSYPYERIRKLLIRAAEERRVTKSKANAIHAEMRHLGFWDSGRPFPEERDGAGLP